MVSSADNDYSGLLLGCMVTGWLISCWDKTPDRKICLCSHHIVSFY